MLPETLQEYYKFHGCLCLAMASEDRPQVTRTARSLAHAQNGTLANFRISVLKQKNIFFGKKKTKSKVQPLSRAWDMVHSFATYGPGLRSP